MITCENRQKYLVDSKVRYIMIKFSIGGLVLKIICVKLFRSPEKVEFCVMFMEIYYNIKEEQAVCVAHNKSMQKADN